MVKPRATMPVQYLLFTMSGGCVSTEFDATIPCQALGLLAVAAADEPNGVAKRNAAKSWLESEVQ